MTSFEFEYAFSTQLVTFSVTKFQEKIFYNKNRLVDYFAT